MRALVVEKSEDGRRAIGETVGPAGVAYDVACDLQQAAMSLFTPVHDVVVTGADLPDGSALELIYMARQAPRRPVVLVVGRRPSREAWCHYVAAGAHHYVPVCELPAVIATVGKRGAQYADDLALLDRIAADCVRSPSALRWLALSIVLRSRRRSEPQLVEVSAVARDVIALLDHAFPPGLTLETELSERYVMGVRAELELLIANLLLNAIDAMPDGGAVQLRVRAFGTSTAIEVVDAGEPPPNWLGLGLAHRVLENHRGVLHLAPNGARGTAVTAVLPSRV
jgi:CheY-like chemotaxis protein